MSWRKPNPRTMCWLTKRRAMVIWGLMAGLVVGFGMIVYWLLSRPPMLPLLTRLDDGRFKHKQWQN